MRIVSTFLGLLVSLNVLGVESLSDTNIFQPKYTNVTRLAESPDDPGIVHLVGQILQRSHYIGQRLDDEVSSKFLDRYLTALDPQHIFFLSSDLKEFESYRYELDNLVLKGDTHPARIIFRRFRTRLDQQYDFVINLLKTEKFEFTGDERYRINRKELPRPESLAEARQLWKARLRYEFLQEKLGMGQPEKIAQTVLETLEEKDQDNLAKNLKDLLGEDRIKSVKEMVSAALEKKETPKAISQQVLDYLTRENSREIVKVINRRYNRVLRTLNEYDNNDVLELYLTSLAHVYDPHSDYMGKSALENFSIGMKLSLFGIGALLRSEDGYCKIVSLTANGPAEKSNKLKPNDRIIAVAQGADEPVDVVDMKLSKVVDLIRGPKGSEVRLTVIPADAPDPSVRKQIRLVRDQIKLEDQEAKAKIFEVPSGEGKSMRLGLIDLPSFYANFDLADGNGSSDPKSTTSDVAKLIKKLKEENIEGLILDLRRNGGGSLEEAINLTGLFIEEGPVVQIRDPSGRIYIDDDPDPSMFYKGPLIVMTSRFSASASEILAGALQDYGRAIIVGDSSTHGKGTVQSLIQLGPILRQRGLAEDVNPGAVKITIRKFYRASGASTQREGVQPDIILPSVNNHADVGEASLENAMKWDTIDPAEFEKYDWVSPYLPDLKKNSQSRIAKNPDYSYINTEIERYKKNLAEKTVSMNEAKRRSEKLEADERLKARKKELAARPKTPGAIIEITLKDVKNPGLPVPADPKDSPDAKGEGENADEDADETPTVDIGLEETKQILHDLIKLGGKSGTLTASTPGLDSRIKN